MEYWIKNYKASNTPKSFEEFAKFLNEERLRPIFFTSTALSPKAKEMANALSIEVKEREPLGEFPRIKCNINSDEIGRQTKIIIFPWISSMTGQSLAIVQASFACLPLKKLKMLGLDERLSIDLTDKYGK